jgi:hypothetical protein
MNGGLQLTVKVTLRHSLNKDKKLSYYINPDDNILAQDWLVALRDDILKKNLYLEKNYCFLGWPNSHRTIELLCKELNDAVLTINKFNFTGIWQKNNIKPFIIDDWYCPETIRWPRDYGVQSFNEQGDTGWNLLGYSLKEGTLNRLHNYFEKLQGTVGQISGWYKYADLATKYAIRQLNTCCHELESLVLSQRKQIKDPEWIRPSQITTFFQAPRHLLTDEHRQGFIKNRYNREFGNVYMHWAQIGKTVYEVWRDEDSSNLNETVCDAITHLQYYSGEFDIEWAKSVTQGADCPWHDYELSQFKVWLEKQNLDYNDPELSLGYLHIGKIDLERSFGTTNRQEIWKVMENYLDIYSIEYDNCKAIYDWHWSDYDYKQKQTERLK